MPLCSFPNKTSTHIFANIARIIALTGLAGRAFGSWQSKKGSMWLRDSLPKDVAGLRVLTYGYPSKLFQSRSTARLLDFSINFMDELKAYMITSKAVSLHLPIRGTPLLRVLYSTALFLLATA